MLYFAWLRERVGQAEEEVDLPLTEATLADLIRVLAARHPALDDALAVPGLVRAAVNQDFAHVETVLADGDEVALFPPVTGG